MNEIKLSGDQDKFVKSSISISRKAKKSKQIVHFPDVLKSEKNPCVVLFGNFDLENFFLPVCQSGIQKPWIIDFQHTIVGAVLVCKITPAGDGPVHLNK